MVLAETKAYYSEDESSPILAIASSESVSFLECYIAFAILLIPFFMQEQDPGMSTEHSSRRAPRLPRCATQSLSVAELVKKYQNYLPAEGIQELTRTAFAPLPDMSESEQETPPPPTYSAFNLKSRHRVPVKEV